MVVEIRVERRVRSQHMNAMRNRRSRGEVEGIDIVFRLQEFVRRAQVACVACRCVGRYVDTVLAVGDFASG